MLIPDVEYLVLFPFLKTAVAQAVRTYHDSLDCQEVVAQLYTIDILLSVQLREPNASIQLGEPARVRFRVFDRLLP